MSAAPALASASPRPTLSQPALSRAPQAPAVIHDRYTLIEPIGRGACAVVYCARDRQTDQLVALKTLEPGRAHGPAAVQRLVHEAEVMSRLDHPHALPLLDLGWFADGRPWLVTELLEGQGLDARLQEGPLPPLLVVRLLRQICDVLAATHAEGFVHGDVKPANLWLQAVWEGRGGPMPIARLLDFGLARSLEDLNTGRRQPAGSPAYVAPELLRGTPVDGRADLYGLGMVAYEALAGVPAFVDPSPRQALLNRLDGQPTPLVFLVPGLDPGLAVLVETLLARNPADRPASAAALDDALANVEARLVAASRPALRLV